MVLICVSLIISDVEYFFMSCWPSVWLLWKNVYLDPLPIFWSNCLFLLMSYMNSLYILGINPFSEIWAADIFSQSIGCLFDCSSGITNIYVFWGEKLHKRKRKLHTQNLKEVVGEERLLINEEIRLLVGG